MSWYRRWGIIGVLALAQVGVIICYQAFLAGVGSPVRAASQEKKSEQPAVAAAKPETQLPVPPVPEVKVEEAGKLELPGMIPLPEPKNLPTLEPVNNARVEVPPPPPFKDGQGSTVMPPAIVPVAAKEPVPDAKTMLITATKPQSDSPPLPLTGDPLLGNVGPAKVEDTHSTLLPTPPVIPTVVKVQQNSLSTDPPEGPPLDSLSKGPPEGPPVVAVKHQTVVGPCPWMLRIEIIKGKTQLTASIGKEVQFRIACEKLDLQAPRGVIDASGTVTLNSEGLEGNCDHLQITWEEEHLVMEGNAQLKCHREGQEVELKSSRLSLRLSGGGVSPTQEPPVNGKAKLSRTVPVTDHPISRTVPVNAPAVVEQPSGVSSVVVPTVSPSNLWPTPKIQD